MSSAPLPSYQHFCHLNEKPFEDGDTGYCLRCSATVDLVVEWLDERRTDGYLIGRTAICPDCDADAVVPESWIDDKGDPESRRKMLRQWQKEYLHDEQKRGADGLGHFCSDF